MPASPPHEPRFGFLDAMDPGKREERSLVSVEHDVTQSIERIAERVATLLTHERRGLPRKDEASIQNRLIRLLHHDTVNALRLRRAIIDRIQQTGNQMSSEVDALLAGATATVSAIRSGRVEFESSHTKHPNLRQFIGMNDVLDAKRKIDLVTIRYEPAPTPSIHEVRLIQVKAGMIAPNEQESVLKTHREYYGEIVAFGAQEREEQKRFAQHIAEQTAAQMLEIPANASPEDQLLAVRNRYSDLFIGILIEHPNTINDDLVAVHVAQNNLSIADLNLFLRTNGGRALLSHVLLQSSLNAGETTSARSLANKLLSWSLHRDLSLNELQSVTPGWTLDPKYVGAQYFLSRTYATGVLVSEQPLNPPDAPPKTLTR